VYVNHGSGQQGIEFWGLSPSDNNAQINNFKQQYGVTHPCAGTQGGGPAAIEIAISGQQFYGYPTWVVVCPDRSFYFDVCWPPTVTCFDPYFESCAPALLAGFSASENAVCENTEVQFTDESIGAVTSWDWSFEGGMPATSTEQNPLVQYQIPGVWDVSLTVSDGTNSHTFESPNLIEVFALPDVSLMPFDTVCVNWAPFELTGGLPEGGIYSGTGVEEGFFYPEIAGLGTHEITYSYTDENGCENAVVEMIEVDLCAGVFNPESNIMNIFPNPSTGEVFIEMQVFGKFKVQVHNLLGVLVYETVITGSTLLNLSDLDSGFYTINIGDGEVSFTKKLTIKK
jgi:PKD repeat protein